MRRWLPLLPALLAATVFLPRPATATDHRTPVCGYQIVAVYPHDPTAFTQGLEIDDGTLFEGTGLVGDSSLRRVELTTGAVLQHHDVPSPYFGEGIAVVGDRIYQLTWQHHLGFIYDRASFAELGTFSYLGEGWGLTYDGEHLIQSDGTATLEFWDVATFAPVRSVQVHDDHGPVTNLNELEFIAGEIFANVWYDTRVARVDPETGEVTTWIQLSGLLESQGVIPTSDMVLNGIAWDANAQRLFVTGKRWPMLFEIVLPACPIGPVFHDGFESGDLGAWLSIP